MYPRSLERAGQYSMSEGRADRREGGNDVDRLESALTGAGAYRGAADLDRAGHVHAVYGQGGALYHATDAGGTWTAELVPGMAPPRLTGARRRGRGRARRATRAGWSRRARAARRRARARDAARG